MSLTNDNKEIDGYDTFKQMRATAEYKKTPMIMLSGKTSPLDEVQVGYDLSN